MKYKARKGKIIMANFCDKCGTPIEDGCTECPNCSVPSEAEEITAEAIEAEITEQQPDAQVNEAQEAEENIAPTADKARGISALRQNKNLVAAIIGAVAVLLIIAIMFIAVIPAFSSYKSTVKRAVRAYIDDDAEEIVNLVSNKMIKATEDAAKELELGGLLGGAFGELDIEELLEEQIQNSIDYDLDRWKEECGRNYKVKYTIHENYITRSDREDLDESLGDIEYDITRKKVVSVTVYFLIEEKAKKNPVYYESSVDIVLIKEGFSWNILSFD